ncbi:MAG: DUF2279 domain-containing protein [Bacteroidota bacterium]|nr:DUF2279 domain-containing protein [Bacteroidota bacterium]
MHCHTLAIVVIVCLWECVAPLYGTIYSQSCVQTVQDSPNEQLSSIQSAALGVGAVDIFSSCQYITTGQEIAGDSSRAIPPQITRQQRPWRYTLDGSPVRAITQLDITKAFLFGGGYALAIGAAQYYQYQAFWSNRRSFRIIEDGDLELGADKAGHVFAGYVMSKLSTDILLTIGIGDNIATVGGGLMGLGYQFFVEVQDGYGVNWGFSPSDMLANAIGVGIHIAQRYIPSFRHITLKAEFYPAPWFGERMRNGASNPIDDYSAWTWWASIDVHELMPESLKCWWPAWLNLAVGYAARNLEWPGEQSRRFILSLDYNLEKLLPNGAPLWNWFRQYLNMLKLPAPALEFGIQDDMHGNRSPMPLRAYILFPFKIGG